MGLIPILSGYYTMVMGEYIMARSCIDLVERSWTSVSDSHICREDTISLTKYKYENGITELR